MTEKGLFFIAEIQLRVLIKKNDLIVKYLKILIKKHHTLNRVVFLQVFFVND